MADEVQPGAVPEKTAGVEQGLKNEPEVTQVQSPGYTTAADKVGGVKPPVETYRGFQVPPRAPSSPDISEKDFVTASRVQRVLNGEEADEGPPGETRSEAWDRHSKEATAHWRATIAIEEAEKIDKARDLAKKFGLDPDRAYNDIIFRRDLEEADRIFDELGLDGREVYANEAQRRALQLLIGSEIRGRRNREKIDRIKKELEEVTQRLKGELESETSRLEGEQGYSSKLRDEMLRLAGKVPGGKGESQQPNPLSPPTDAAKE